MAYQFTAGTEQALSAGSSTIFQLGSAFSGFIRANPTTAGTNRNLFSYYYYINGAAEQGYLIRITSANVLQFYNPNGTNQSSTGTVSTSTDNSLGFTYDGSTVRLYINGAQDGSGSPGSFSYSNAVFRVANPNTPDGFIQQSFPGTLSECAIWNAALTDAEILSLSRGFTADQIRPQSLQFYAPLVRDLQDVRGGRTITNINGATVATHPRIIK